ncbi:ribosomal protein S12 [Mycena rebaudengoi]|nr:ribosomal protein S12 [Mycena rebaudengoi]
MLSALRAWTRPLQSLPRTILSQPPNIASPFRTPPFRDFHASPPSLATLNQACRRKKHNRRVAKSRSPLLMGAPQRKGVCSQVFTQTPKKPNSGKRKVARVKLSTGKSCMASTSVVLVRGGRAQDLPGVQYKVVRGALDLGGVVNRVGARSIYGVKKPKK